MPIKGLSDRIVPRFPSLGKLHKGGEKGASGFGADLDHFRFASERPEVVEAFTAAFGQEPKILSVFLPYRTVDENFSTWKEKWGKSGLIHRCDGETMTRWLGDDGKYHDDPKPCPYHGKVQTAEEKKKDPPCDEIGRLCMVIPQLFQAGYVGFVTMETHSINDIATILEVLVQTYESRGDNPLGLKGIEWYLRRVERSISVPGFTAGAVRQRVKKWLVSIEPAPDWVRIQIEMQHREQLALPPVSDLPDAHTDAVEVDPETGEVMPAPGETRPALTVTTPAQSINPKPAAVTIPAIPDAVKKAGEVESKTGKLGAMTPAQLMTLIAWYNNPETKETDKKKYQHVKDAADTLLDWHEAQNLPETIGANAQSPVVTETTHPAVAEAINTVSPF